MGITPHTIARADIDETPRPHELPRLYAQRMAREKAEKLAPSFPSSHLILTADTVVARGRMILPKAETPDDVRTCLNLLANRSHRVYTAVCGTLGQEGGKQHSLMALSRVAVRNLTPEEKEHYVASGQGIGCAGGYAIQGLFAIFVRQIIGSHSAIVGLPLYEVARILNRFQWSW